MNVRIFWVRSMECMCAQTRPQFILSSKRVLGEWSQKAWELQRKNPLNWRPEEVWTCDAASGKTASPTHYRPSYSGTLLKDKKVLTALAKHNTSHQIIRAELKIACHCNIIFCGHIANICTFSIKLSTVRWPLQALDAHNKDHSKWSLW